MNAQSKEFSVWALSGISRELLWKKSLREPLLSIQCGLQTGSSDPLHWRETLDTSACVLISSGHMITISASTGRTCWTAAVRDVESHAVLLPDLQGDAFPDLLIATLPADQVTVATRSSLYPGQRVTAVTWIQYVSRPDGGSASRKDLYSPERQRRPGHLEPRYRSPVKTWSATGTRPREPDESSAPVLQAGIELLVSSGQRRTGPTTEPGFSQGVFSILSPMEIWFLCLV